MLRPWRIGRYKPSDALIQANETAPRYIPDECEENQFMRSSSTLRRQKCWIFEDKICGDGDHLIYRGLASSVGIATMEPETKL